MQRRPGGPKHARVARLNQLRCDVSRHVRARLVVRADRADRDPPDLNRQAVDLRADHRLDAGELRKRPDLARDLTDPRPVEPQPVKNRGRQRRAPGRQVGGVRLKQRIRVPLQSGRDISQHLIQRRIRHPPQRCGCNDRPACRLFHMRRDVFHRTEPSVGRPHPPGAAQADPTHGREPDAAGEREPRAVDEQ